jgi:hypothetical protein
LFWINNNYNANITRMSKYKFWTQRFVNYKRTFQFNLRYLEKKTSVTPLLCHVFSSADCPISVTQLSDLMRLSYLYARRCVTTHYEVFTVWKEVMLCCVTVSIVICLYVWAWLLAGHHFGVPIHTQPNAHVSMKMQQLISPRFLSLQFWHHYLHYNETWRQVIVLTFICWFNTLLNKNMLLIIY